MKKVRFESPVKNSRNMEDYECHSPRPFISKQEAIRPDVCYGIPRLLTYNPDPVQRYECSNSFPYPQVEKTSLDKHSTSSARWPSNDLDLSMLDSSQHNPRIREHCMEQKFMGPILNSENVNSRNLNKFKTPTTLCSVENTKLVLPTKSNVSDNNFFIKRDNMTKLYSENINPLNSQFNRISLDKENSPLMKKAELMMVGPKSILVEQPMQHSIQSGAVQESSIPDECRCHHCVKLIQNAPCNLPRHKMETNQNICQHINKFAQTVTPCMHAVQTACHYNNARMLKQSCNCYNTNSVVNQPHNLVDKKTWMIEKYEQKRDNDCKEVEKQINTSKEKREPTVSDLFKIIKLQNEQLQLLQEKVEKFISASNSCSVNVPLQNYVTEHAALETLDSEQHKISIGVMTSFEMVRTSTVINKEIVTKTNESAQIQCNKSQISIKEVVSKTQPANLNFLEGIVPVGRTLSPQAHGNEECNIQDCKLCNTIHKTDMNDEKTLNELSLYNVQVDNATTPLLSPEQSLYLDVRDYSESECGSDNQSNVGWTYYNRVMTHVNGVLQDSEMPSSASAMCRNMRQQCVQMQIDKTNVSVTKRVKFGDDPLGIHQPHIIAASTDTSIKMNQLAAKYLKSGVVSPVPTPMLSKPSAMPIDMSFATRNYMERHRILQGPALSPVGEIPRFLDITALKQQPKLL